MPIKILSVDDSKMVRMLLTRAFKKFDCQLIEAGNGAEGVRMAAEHKPDLVILDFTMPEMDGLEVMTALKSNPELKSIPVVMLTAERSQTVVVELGKLGVRDYLMKPFKEQDIIDRVGRIVQLVPIAG